MGPTGNFSRPSLPVNGRLSCSQGGGGAVRRRAYRCGNRRARARAAQVEGITVCVCGLQRVCSKWEVGAESRPPPPRPQRMWRGGGVVISLPLSLCHSLAFSLLPLCVSVFFPCDAQVCGGFFLHRCGDDDEDFVKKKKRFKAKRLRLILFGVFIVFLSKFHF